MFKFNKTANDLHFISMKKIAQFASVNQLNMEVVDETRFTSNVMIVMKKKE
jgi:hypothetical protein